MKLSAVLRMCETGYCVCLCGLSWFTLHCRCFIQYVGSSSSLLYVCVCLRSFLCRVVAIDEHNRVAVLSLPADADIQLTSERASFFLVRAVT